MELYRQYRPKKFEDVIGQESAVKILKEKFRKKDVPHVWMFSGPSGTGKTTLARIFAKQVGCSNRDFKEVNCADFRGIDMVRDIRSAMNRHPFQGTSLVWLIDEVHRQTGDASDAFLKLLEDCPKHVYFLFATTDPNKIKRTFRDRCTHCTLSPLKYDHITWIIANVADKEGKQLSGDLLHAIADKAEGSARKALQLLDSVIDIEGEDAQLEALSSCAEADKEAVNIARLLLNPQIKWDALRKALNEVQEEPETIRRSVLGYAAAVMKKDVKQAPRCYLIITCFRDNWYDVGQAGLVAACWEVRSQAK